MAPPQPCLYLPVHCGWPAGRPGMCAAAMGNAGEDEAYFQRSSLFWVTVIILSFGYYTVRTGAPRKAR